MAGAGDTASFAAGTRTTIANHHVTDYNQSAGTLLGMSALTVNGSAFWSGGVMTGTGITLLGGATSLAGDYRKDLTGGRVLTLAGASSWSGNSGVNGNIIVFAGGTLNNSGSVFDGNAFNTMVQNFSGTNAFNNSGSCGYLGCGWQLWAASGHGRGGASAARSAADPSPSHAVDLQPTHHLNRRFDMLHRMHRPQTPASGAASEAGVGSVQTRTARRMAPKYRLSGRLRSAFNTRVKRLGKWISNVPCCQPATIASAASSGRISAGM